MKCKVCATAIKVTEIYNHLQKSKPCQEGYDVEQIHQFQSKRQERLEKMKMCSRERYKRNRDEILNKKAEYYMKNKESIRDVQAEYYSKNTESIRDAQAEYYGKNKEIIRVTQNEYYKRSRSLTCQRKRFRKHFKHEDASKYITGHQVHLYHHTKGICQSETLKEFNHSVEYYDGLCNFCHENRGVKLVGVNRQVCLGCNRAKCTMCDIETSPNPELGCLHYSPDMGSKLGFIPGHCPLYSISGFPSYSFLVCITNQLPCKLCKQITEDYPEYSLFGEMENVYASSRRSFEKVGGFVYTCNLCGNKSNFICEFDLHMRNHTKWGKRVAIVAIRTPLDQEHVGYERVKEESFLVLEQELMKAKGVSAVIAIFKKNRFERFFKKDNLEDVNLVASLLLKEGVDIHDELSNVSINQQIIEKLVVVEVRSHFLTDHSCVWRYYENEAAYTAKKSFEELLRWEEEDPVQDFYPVKDSRWYRRSTALLSSRCSLLCPGEDRYQGLAETSPPNFSSQVLQFLWVLVKNSGLCCCVSKFFCSTSTDLEKCKEGCCGKCEVEKVPGLESNQSGTDEMAVFEEEEEEVSENDEEEEEKVSEDEENGEDDSEANDDVDWWEDQC